MERAAVPRGRHAPPLEVRLGVQRARLLQAAAEVFARAGYADASAEAVARAAGMSKATFYEHFANKEDTILALFDAAAEHVLGAMATAASAAGDDPQRRLRAGIHAFLGEVATRRNEAQTLLVEIIGAGPRPAERRDAILSAFADTLYAEAEGAARRGRGRGFASRLDAYAAIAAAAELASRSLRRGEPRDVRELEPVIERIMTGLLQR